MLSGRIYSLSLAVAVSLAVLGGFAPGEAKANAMHGFCVAPTPACSDNGSITPTDDPSPNFGFRNSPNSGSFDDFNLVVLIPNSVAGAFAETINVTGTNVSYTLPVNLTLVSTTAWTSGKLDQYLGINASPNNPIGAFLPLTQVLQPAATGYAVYTFNFGSGQFSNTTDPQFTTLFTFPAGSIITAFWGDEQQVCKKVYNPKTGKKETVCTTKIVWTGTANSSSIIINKTTNTPEPASIALLSAGLFGLGFARRRKKS